MLLLQSTLEEPPAGAGVHQLGELLSVEVEQVLEVNASVGELLKNPLVFCLRGEIRWAHIFQRYSSTSTHTLHTSSLLILVMWMCTNDAERICAARRAQKLPARTNF